MDMDRDAFILAMIAELEVQSKGSTQFFTGQRKSPSDLFRKMCYDYPDVADDDILRLKNAISDYLSGEEVNSSHELHNVFALNEAFLTNVIRMSNHTPSESTDSSLQSNSAAMRSLACVVFTSSPCWLLQRSQEELSNIFFDNSYCLINNFPRPGDIEQLSWGAIWMNFQNIILRSSVTVFQGSTKDEIVQHGYLKKLLETISHFLSVFSQSSTAKLNDQSNLKQTLMTYMIDLASVDGEDPDEVVSAGKELLSHMIHLYFDILSSIPSLLHDHFAPIVNLLFNAATTDQFSGPSLGERIGLTAFGNFASSLSQALENEKTRASTNLTVEVVRKHFVSDQNLSRVVSVGERLLSKKLSSAGAPGSALDMETAITFIEILDLLVYKDVNSTLSSISARPLFDRLISSRLLACVLNVFNQILIIQTQLLLSSTDQRLNSCSALWQLSCRLCMVLTRTLNISPEARSYFVHYVALQSSLQECVSSFASTGFEDRLNTIWLPCLAVPVLYSSIYTGRLPGQESPELNGWRDILDSSMSQLQHLLGLASSAHTESPSDEATDFVSDELKAKYHVQRLSLEGICKMVGALGSNTMVETMRMTVSCNALHANELKQWTSSARLALGNLRSQLNNSTSNPNFAWAERGLHLCKHLESVMDGGRSSKSD